MRRKRYDSETQIEHQTRISGYKKNRWNDNPETFVVHHVQSPYLLGDQWKSKSREEQRADHHKISQDGLGYQA
jgi:hypothetical protein